MQNKFRVKFFALIIFTILAVITGGIFEYIYFNSNESPIPSKRVQDEINKKEVEAELITDNIKDLIKRNRLDSISFSNIFNSDICVYIFRKNDLVFWNTNQYDISKLNINLYSENISHPINLPSLVGVVKVSKIKQYSIVTLIPIKERYSFLNSNIEDNFPEYLGLNNKIIVTSTESADGNSIYSNSGGHLFSLELNYEVIYNKMFANISIIAYSFAFILFFLSFYRFNWFIPSIFQSLRKYSFVFIAYLTIVLSLLKLNVPSIIFSGNIFSNNYYETGEHFSSFGQLLFLTLFLAITVFTLYVKVPLNYIRNNKRASWIWLIIVELFSVVIYITMLTLQEDLVRNSSFEMALYKIENLSLYTLLAFFITAIIWILFILLRDKFVALIHFVIPMWKLILFNLGISITAIAIVMYLELNILNVVFASSFFILVSIVDVFRYKRHRYISFFGIMFLVLVYSGFLVTTFYNLIEAKKQDNYRLAADKMIGGEYNLEEAITQKTLSLLDKKITDDRFIRSYVSETTNVSGEKLFRYLNKFYLIGEYWGNYDAKIIIEYQPLDSITIGYQKMISDSTLVLYTANIYKNISEEKTFEYLAKYNYTRESKQPICLYIELHKKKINSYTSFFSIILSETKQINSNISTARYNKSTLESKTGNYVYSPKLNQSNAIKGTAYENGYSHHYYSYMNDIVIVVSERQHQPLVAFLIFFSYLFTFYLLLSIVIYYNLVKYFKNPGLKNRFFNKLQQTFITFIFFTITLIFTVTLIFIFLQYKEKQNNELYEKTKYIKAHLESLGKQIDLVKENTNSLHILSKELSTLYQTDIKLYNKQGELVATSEPHLISIGVINSLINPNPFFKYKNQIYIQEENFGEVKFIASYSPLFDSKMNLVGYFSLPAFTSQNDLKMELYTFIAIFINIYIIVIILAIIISIILSRALIKPIRTIENRLKLIKFGKANEKIEYNSSERDEFSNLIIQYNGMVDQLALSAEMIAQSERESAWREMARQIAHEIKNPLTPMKLTIQQLQRLQDLDQISFQTKLAKSTRILIEQIDNLNRIASEFSSFSRLPKTILSKVNIVEKIEHIVNLFSHDSNYEMTFTSADSEIYINTDGEQIIQVFNNLIKNATQSIPSDRKGIIKVSISYENDNVVIVVEDNGSGISEEAQAKLFLPNFTTKSSGMGLGLSIVKSIVTASNGTITFNTIEDSGTQFIVKFPRIKQQK